MNTIMRIINILFAVVILLSMVVACSSAPAAITPGKVIDVKKGDIDITVRSEGKLTTPDQYNLAFGVQGIVQEILVEQGAKVRAGALLASIDPWTQVNAIKTALFSVQSKQNALLICGDNHLPYNYPDMSISRMADEAQSDIDRAAGYFNQGSYKDAGYWLVMAYFDILICEDLIRTMPDVAQLAGAKSNSIYYPQTEAGDFKPLSADKQEAVNFLAQYRYSIKNTLNDMKNPGVPYSKIGIAIESVRQKVADAAQVAKSMVAIKTRMVFEYPDTSASADFVQETLRLIGGLEATFTAGDYRLNQAVRDLYASLVNLQVARDVLETQTLIFETGSGINWKTLQQYNLDLQASEISFYITKRDIMKTVIIAPADGDVFSVNLKVNDALSAKDYATRPAVGLVDTQNVKFEGKVDEIDIMKVKKGQQVTLEVDALGERKLKGEVEFISPFGAKESNVVKFDVTIKLATDATMPRLLSGWTTTTEILIASAKNAIIIPPSLIIKTPAGPVVLVVTSDPAKPERRPVRVGLQNLQHAEILSGLNEGEKVQVPSKSDLESIPTYSPRPGSPPRQPR